MTTELSSSAAFQHLNRLIQRIPELESAANPLTRAAEADMSSQSLRRQDFGLRKWRQRRRQRAHSGRAYERVCPAQAPCRPENRVFEEQWSGRPAEPGIELAGRTFRPYPSRVMFPCPRRSPTTTIHTWLLPSRRMFWAGPENSDRLEHVRQLQKRGQRACRGESIRTIDDRLHRGRRLQDGYPLRRSHKGPCKGDLQVAGVSPAALSLPVPDGGREFWGH